MPTDDKRRTWLIPLPEYRTAALEVPADPTAADLVYVRQFLVLLENVIPSGAAPEIPNAD